MGVFKNLLSAGRKTARYKALYGDEEKKSKSVIFGIESIVMSLLTAIIALGGTFLVTMKNENVIVFIVGLLFGIALIVAAIGTFVSALTNMLYQFKLNKKAVSWISLATFILSIVGIVIGIFIFIF